jgi:hypothetical protein
MAFSGTGPVYHVYSVLRRSPSPWFSQEDLAQITEDTEGTERRKT